MRNLVHRACTWFLAGTLIFSFAQSLSANVSVRMANNPSLSPDGQTILFDWMGEIWSVPAIGGEATRLTQHPANDSQPLFSPDGEQIAFVSNRSGSNQIYIMSANGSLPRQVTYHSEGYRLADWFPDGNSLLATGSRDHHWRSSQRMLRIDLETRRAEKVLVDAYGDDPRLNDDGSKILFSREGERWWRKGYTGERSAQIWEYDLETNQFTELLHEGVGCRWPVPMRDRSGFYFCKSDPSGWDLFKYKPAKNDKPAKQIKVVGFEDDAICFPRISKDGSKIVFRHLFDLYTLSTEKGARPSKIEINIGADIDLPSDLIKERLKSATNVAFSEDGLEIAFVSGGDLWVMDTELREPVRVTQTDGAEDEPIFSADGNTLWFTSTKDGQVDIYRAKRSDEEAYWWQNEAFKIEQFTSTADVEENLSLTPDNESLVYNRGLGALTVHNIESDETHQLLSAFRGVDYDVSSDSQWIAYALQDNDFNSEIWVRRLDGTGKPVNISRHPDNDFNPTFSPDGKILAFTGRRDGQESDIYYVYLQNDEAEKNSRERTIEDAIELMKKKRKSSSKKDSKRDNSKSTDNSDSESEKNEDQNESAKNEESTDDEKHKIDIDFEDIHERVRRIPNLDAFESSLLFSPDSKKLAFITNVNGKSGWYTVEFPSELQPKFLAATTGRFARWPESAKAIQMLAGGTPTSISANGTATRYGFTAFRERSRRGRFREGFNAAWRTMRDVWYDPAYNNNNWAEIRRKYVELAAQSPDTGALASIVELMLGELNGSHLGFTPVGVERFSTDDDWQETTAHLGVRFDPAFKGPGLLVRDVILGSPADQDKSRLMPGDVILSIEGTSVDPDYDLTKILNGRLARDIQLTVSRLVSKDESIDGDDAQSDESASDTANVDGNQNGDEKNQKIEEIEISLRPISFGAARALLYRHWVASNQDAVTKLSDGKLGYLHIRAMNQSSFLEFERQLYNVGYGRDGLVIDVRDNGGGSTTDLLLTTLTQPRHAITVPRGGGNGYPHDRKVFASWHKPIIVLCNQNSYSNAEIFSHAIKTLKRGQLVGVQTAGGVVSTGAAMITDVGRIRVPFRGWFLVNDGKDMERNGAEPHVIIWPQPSEMPRGIDRQLEKAVELLAEEVANVPADPNLQYASESE